MIALCDGYIQDGPILWYGPNYCAAVVGDFGFLHVLAWGQFASAWDVFIATGN